MSKYLQQANKLAQTAVVLTEAQKAAIADLEKKVELQKNQLNLALELIDRDVDQKNLEPRLAKVERARAEAETEAAIEELHLKIREINPSFVSNAKEQVEEVAARFAYHAVEFSGKAAGTVAQIFRPFWQAGKRAFDEAKSTSVKKYEEPAKHSQLNDLERASKSQNNG